MSAVELRAVERAFGAVDALRGVSLSIPRGALIALTGPSGSGKTTLLNLVAGLDTPSAGEVRVLGEHTGDLGEAGLTALRRRLGLVFQSFALLPSATAYENVELGLRISGRAPQPEWRGRAMGSLEALGLGRWAHHRAYELSGGQQQRVAIARALAPGPELIVADEPTGDLDGATARHVLGLLRGLADAAGVTVILATHDPAAVAAATHVVALRDGVLEG